MLSPLARETAASPTGTASDVPWGVGEALMASAVSLLLAATGGGAVFFLLADVSVTHPIPPGRRLFDWANGVPVQTLPAVQPLVSDILAYQFLVLGVALSALWLIRVRFRLTPGALGYSFPGWQALLASALVVVPLVYVGIVVVSVLFDSLLPGYHLQGNARELLQGENGRPSLGEQVLVFLWAAVEAPIAEETLFRGIIFQGLRHRFTRWLPLHWAVAAGAILSGLAFGLVHLQPQTLPILVLLGIVLAYVFQRTRSLYASALVHGIVNGVSVLALFNLA